ncbi:MAG: type II secretion system GspH family protein [Planctomycetota bacterium]|jgi:prepilin-type N-terminal cleavage/methylation domain-containing protein|nr:type II secretion system GspH family protein [Planctomycetota bacterium]
MKPQEKNFTLIEMLIVVAIIGILAALLSGPLMRARRTAQLTGCTNNLHQIGLTVASYSTQLMPGTAVKFAGMAHIYDEFNGVDVPKQIFRCPVDQDSTRPISYGWNPNLNVANMPANQIAAADWPTASGDGPDDADAAPHYNDGTTILYGSNQVRRLTKGATDDGNGVSIPSDLEADGGTGFTL